MRVMVTGTPGTGKTSVTNQLNTPLEIIHLNDVIAQREFVKEQDPTRDTVIADMTAIQDWLRGRDDVLVESHLAHHFEANRVIVLRCHPEELTRRLRERDEAPDTIAENAESEALDLLLSEAVTEHGPENVYEIDTTDHDPAWVGHEIEAVIDGRREPASGIVDFSTYL